MLSFGKSEVYRRSRISKPAAIASTAMTVVMVGEILTLSSGRIPVRINQTARRCIPKFLPAKLLVNAMVPPLASVIISLATYTDQRFRYSRPP